jgi:hypothetical protein
MTRGSITLLLAAIISFAPFAAKADQLSNACQGGESPLATSDSGQTAPTPCVVASGDMLVQSLYFQNASKVGGSALAEYPLVNARIGVAKALEIDLNTPSEVAYSGSHGAGVYQTTEPGVGFQYAFDQGQRFVTAVGGTLDPAVSQFVPVLTQSKYSLDLTSAYRLDSRWSLDAAALTETPARVGFDRTLPAATLGVTYDPDQALQITSGFGSRVAERGDRLQKYGDLSLGKLLGKKVSLDVGVGSALNATANTKAHYLEAGLSVLR